MHVDGLRGPMHTDGYGYMREDGVAHMVRTALLRLSDQPVRDLMMENTESKGLSRRLFLAAPIVVHGWIWAARPANASLWFRDALSLVRVGSGILHGARIASRGSRAFSRGITYSRAITRPGYGAPQPPVKSSYGFISPARSRLLAGPEKAKPTDNTKNELRSSGNNISALDKAKYEVNLYRLIADMSTRKQSEDTLEILSHWREYWESNNHSILANRRHIDDCPKCDEAFLALTRGTDMAYLPIKVPFRVPNFL